MSTRVPTPTPYLQPETDLIDILQTCEWALPTVTQGTVRLATGWTQDVIDTLVEEQRLILTTQDARLHPRDWHISGMSFIILLSNHHEEWMQEREDFLSDNNQPTQSTERLGPVAVLQYVQELLDTLGILEGMNTTRYTHGPLHFSRLTTQHNSTIRAWIHTATMHPCVLEYHTASTRFATFHDGRWIDYLAHVVLPATNAQRAAQHDASFDKIDDAEVFADLLPTPPSYTHTCGGTLQPVRTAYLTEYHCDQCHRVLTPEEACAYPLADAKRLIGHETPDLPLRTDDKPPQPYIFMCACGGELTRVLDHPHFAFHCNNCQSNITHDELNTED